MGPSKSRSRSRKQEAGSRKREAGSRHASGPLRTEVATLKLSEKSEAEPLWAKLAVVSLCVRIPFTHVQHDVHVLQLSHKHISMPYISA